METLTTLRNLSLATIKRQRRGEKEMLINSGVIYKVIVIFMSVFILMVTFLFIVKYKTL